MSESQAVKTAEKCDSALNKNSETNWQKLLQLARKNLPLFPLKHHGKTPLIAKWQEKATTDPAQLREWFDKFPGCNWGMLTGRASGTCVLDVDGETGEQSRAELERKIGPLPETWEQTTGKGRHLIFRHSGGDIPTTAGRLGKGLDTRGDGGYIAVEPSIHPNGTPYRLDADAPISEVPNALIELLTKQDVPSAECADDIDEIPEGIRNSTTFKLVLGMFQSGMSTDDVLKAALLINQTRCKPPLSDDEVTRTVQSASRYKQDSKETRNKRRCPLYWLPHNVPSFMSEPSTAQLADYQRGWWLTLTGFAWMRAGILPADPVRLFKLSGAKSKPKFLAEHADVLFAFEPATLGGQSVLVNHRMVDDYADALEKWLQQVEAGKKRQESVKQELEQFRQQKVAA